MQRLAMVVATIFLGSTSLYAQDLRQVVEEMKKMQAQITALQTRTETLERTVTALRLQMEEVNRTSAGLNSQVSELQIRVTKLTDRLDKVFGFEQVGSGYVFNVPGPVTIRGGALNFESTGGLLLKGSTTTLHGTSSLSLLSNAGTTITTGAQLDITAGSITNLTSGTALNLTSGGTSTFQAPSSVTVKTGNANIETTGAFNVRANGIATVEGGELLLKGSAAVLHGTTRLNLKALDITLEANSTINIKAAGDLNLRASSIKQN